MLRSILDVTPSDGFIAHSSELRQALSYLEWNIPGWIREVHEQWQHTLDGLLPEFVQKTGPRAAHVAGFAILIEDQSLVAFDLALQISSSSDSISWFDLKIGERGRSGMVRIPYCSPGGRRAIAGRLSDIDWQYHVGFGERE